MSKDGRRKPKDVGKVCFLLREERRHAAVKIEEEELRLRLGVSRVGK